MNERKDKNKKDDGSIVMLLSSYVWYNCSSKGLVHYKLQATNSLCDDGVNIWALMS